MRSTACGSAVPRPAMSMALPRPTLDSSASAPMLSALAACGASSLTGMWPWSAKAVGAQRFDGGHGDGRVFGPEQPALRCMRVDAVHAERRIGDIQPADSQSSGHHGCFWPSRPPVVVSDFDALPQTLMR